MIQIIVISSRESKMLDTNIRYKLIKLKNEKCNNNNIKYRERVYCSSTGWTAVVQSWMRGEPVSLWECILPITQGGQGIAYGAGLIRRQPFQKL